MRTLNELNNNEKREIANKLSLFLLSFFSKDFYLTEESLHKDFNNFKAQPFFKDIVKQFEKENGIDVGYLLKTKRWKLCSVCNRPFISFDRGNKQTLCRYEVYIRYTSENRKINIQERSNCEMIQRQKASLNWVHRKEDEYFEA